MGKTKRNETAYRKSHHANLGEKVSKRVFNEEEELEIAEATDSLDWERYCGNCDNFKNPVLCPFYPTTEDTLWKEELDCKNYWD